MPRRLRPVAIAALSGAAVLGSAAVGTALPPSSV